MPRAQRRLHEVAHGQDVVVRQEGHVRRHGVGEPRGVFVGGWRSGSCGGSCAVALLLERQERVGAARVRAATSASSSLPGVGHEVHVLQVPVVVRRCRCPTARSSLGACGVEPRGERVGGAFASSDVRLERWRLGRRAARRTASRSALCSRMLVDAVTSRGRGRCPSGCPAPAASSAGMARMPSSIRVACSALQREG